MNHLSGDCSVFEERHLSLLESTVLNGLTIAPGPVAVFGQHTQSDPLGNTKDLQTLLFSQLCLAALQESEIKIKDLKMSMSSLKTEQGKASHSY